MDQAHLLVVDDDQRLRNLLKKYLTEQGFLISSAQDAAEAREKLHIMIFDMVILDVMMPGETGFELAKAIRTGQLPQLPQLPLLFLTAMGESTQRIEGLEIGADDYIIKPFEPRELVLRINSILRRISANALSIKIKKIGPYEFDMDKLALSQAGQAIYLTTVESQLLKVLAAASGQPLEREVIAERMGGNLSPRSIDVQITRLRRKLEQDPRQPLYLQTLRNQGYVLWSQD